MKPFSIIRDVVRAREILAVLVRYGFSGLLKQLDIPASWISKLVTREQLERSAWERIRLACEDLGPTFVKMGQNISTRADLLPRPLIQELEKLRDKVKPEPFENVRKTLEAELGPSFESYFENIEEIPLGSGSIAQVHFAVLKSKQEKVALKVQRPDIERRVQADLEILGWLAREIHERISDLKPYNLPDLIQSLRRAIREELDFTQEARYAQIFQNNNPHEEYVFAPKVIPSYSSRRVLVTEFIEGVSPQEANLSIEESRTLAEYGGRSVFHQILINGFFHADPHSGNVLITPDKRLCLIDWGLSGHLTRRMRYRMADLFSAVLERNAEAIVRVAQAINEDGHMLDQQELELAVTQVMSRYPNELEVADLGRCLLDLLYTFGRNGISLARDYALLAKAMLAIDQTGRALDAQFALKSVAEPYFRKLTWQQNNPKHILEQSWRSIRELAGILSTLPHELQGLIRRINAEDIEITLRHDGLNQFSETVSSSFNRLVLAVIIGALVIGSSLIITTGLAPLLFGYPALGLIGYVMSAVLGLWLIIDIIRHGRHL